MRVEANVASACFGCDCITLEPAQPDYLPGEHNDSYLRGVVYFYPWIDHVLWHIDAAMLLDLTLPQAEALS